MSQTLWAGVGCLSSLCLSGPSLGDLSPGHQGGRWQGGTDAPRQRCLGERHGHREAWTHISENWTSYELCECLSCPRDAQLYIGGWAAIYLSLSLSHSPHPDISGAGESDPAAFNYRDLFSLGPGLLMPKGCRADLGKNFLRKHQEGPVQS